MEIVTLQPPLRIRRVRRDFIEQIPPRSPFSKGEGEQLLQIRHNKLFQAFA